MKGLGLPFYDKKRHSSCMVQVQGFDNHKADKREEEELESQSNHDGLLVFELSVKSKDIDSRAHAKHEAEQQD